MKVRNEIEIPQSAIDEATQKEIKSLKAKLRSAEKKIEDRDSKIRMRDKLIKEQRKELDALDELRRAARVFYDMGREEGAEQAYNNTRGAW